MEAAYKNEVMFKMELDVTYPIPRTITKHFNSLKVLRQWEKRNDPDGSLTILETRKYILTDKGYERYHVFGNTIVPLSKLIQITTFLIKNEESKSSFFRK